MRPCTTLAVGGQSWRAWRVTVGAAEVRLGPLDELHETVRSDRELRVLLRREDDRLQGRLGGSPCDLPDGYIRSEDSQHVEEGDDLVDLDPAENLDRRAVRKAEPSPVGR